eukprot:12259682-Alexandrium_andersonii.AAC.1
MCDCEFCPSVAITVLVGRHPSLRCGPNARGGPASSGEHQEAVLQGLQQGAARGDQEALRVSPVGPAVRTLHVWSGLGA